MSLSSRRRWAIILALTVASFALGQVTNAAARPPNIPSKATAQSELNALTVAAEGSMSGYSRDLFPHWTTVGGCSTRETVLKRDGSGVVVGSGCYPTSGSWFSQYDGVTLGSAGSVDIDHVVALAEAWRSGASCAARVTGTAWSSSSSATRERWTGTSSRARRECD